VLKIIKKDSKRFSQEKAVSQGCVQCLDRERIYCYNDTFSMCCDPIASKIRQGEMPPCHDSDEFKIKCTPRKYDDMYNLF
jgi:hypothetical protein